MSDPYPFPECLTCILFLSVWPVSGRQVSVSCSKVYYLPGVSDLYPIPLLNYWTVFGIWASDLYPVPECLTFIRLLLHVLPGSGSSVSVLYSVPADVWLDLYFLILFILFTQCTVYPDPERRTCTQNQSVWPGFRVSVLYLASNCLTCILLLSVLPEYGFWVYSVPDFWLAFVFEGLAWNPVPQCLTYIRLGVWPLSDS